MWVTPEDVLDRWTGDDIPAVDDDLLVTLTGDSEVLIVSKFPNLQNRIDDETLDVRLVKIVSSQMVQRAYNSEHSGKQSYSYGSGPFSESGSYSDVSNKGLYISEEEMEMLRPEAVRTDKASSINLDTHRENFYIRNSYYYPEDGWEPISDFRRI